MLPAAAPIPEASKPKARDIQRFLAIASSMVGDELEEGVTSAPVAAATGSRRDNVDAVLSREALKRATASKVSAAEAREKEPEK